MERGQNAGYLSIFSFSHNVFKRPLSQGCYMLGLCGKELKLGLCGKELKLGLCGKELKLGLCGKQLTLYLTCQFLALLIQQQIKIIYNVKNIDKWGYNFLTRKHCGNIAGYEQFILFPQHFQKLSVVDALKSVSME